MTKAECDELRKAWSSVSKESKLHFAAVIILALLDDLDKAIASLDAKSFQRPKHQVTVERIDWDRRVQIIETYTLSSTREIPIQEGPDRVEESNRG